ncbi:MAG: hypothetical protein E7268_01160 [Lachnospiraceae bacterium]|nr:hypothetical protein [Lachnospiraceae bacterium]
MKSYLKILMITMAIQLGCFGINVLLVNTMPMESPLSDLGIWIFLAGFPIALIVDIVLAIRWGESLKQKLIYIFLMPTNYMGPILAAGFFLYLRWIYEQMFGV